MTNWSSETVSKAFLKQNVMMNSVDFFKINEKFMAAEFIINFSAS